MKPTQALRSGGGDTPLGMYNKYIGNWGSFGTKNQKQKGIVTYGVSSNRQNPLAGVAHAAIFNTWRRTSAQILYVVPPFVAGYYIMQWATERNHYLNSKAGIAEFGGDEE